MSWETVGKIGEIVGQLAPAVANTAVALKNAKNQNQMASWSTPLVGGAAQTQKFDLGQYIKLPTVNAGIDSKTILTVGLLGLGAFMLFKKRR